MNHIVCVCVYSKPCSKSYSEIKIFVKYIFLGGGGESIHVGQQQAAQVLNNSIFTPVW